MADEVAENAFSGKINAVQLHDELITKMKTVCVKCNGFLFPPVMLGTKGSICGSCWENTIATDENFIPNVPLQEILQQLCCPCKYVNNGCEEERMYNEMAFHLKQCIYQNIACPINSLHRCIWYGYTDNILQHFEKCHHKNIINSTSNSVIIEIFKQKDVQLLQLACGKFILVIESRDCHKLNFMVYSIENHPESVIKENYHFMIHLSVSGNAFINYKSEMENIVNIVNCSNCSMGTEIDFGLLDDNRYVTQEVTYICTLEITNKRTTKNELLKYFECPICRYWMRPPIYQCSTGHSFCTECKNKFSNCCPLCKLSFGTVRNFALEELSNEIYFPCKFSDQGCNQKLKLTEIDDHEEMCRFRQYDCPLADNCSINCSWSGGYTDLLKHLQTNHTDLIFTHQKVFETKIGAQNEFKYTYCLIAYKKLFRISHKRNSATSGGQLFWSVQLVGPRKKALNYGFEVVLFKKALPHIKLTRSDVCSGLTKYSNIFDKKVILSMDIVSPLLVDNKLNDYVKIVKIII